MGILTQQHDNEMRDLLRKSVDRYKALSPVQRAIHDLEQRRSWVIGQTSEETSVKDILKILDQRAEYVLLAEYKRLKAEYDRLTAPKETGL